MIQRSYSKYAVVLIFLVFLLAYYKFSFGDRTDTVFLTITTFTFAIFSGFFISRQASRQAAVRNKMDEMGGILSFIYRAFGHFSKERQARIGALLKKHYEAQLESNDWALYFRKKSTLLTDIHAELDSVMGSAVGQKKSHAVNRIMAGLLDAQKIRKNLVSLGEENIPAAQWLLITLLALILLVTVSALPSQGQILESVLKAAFSTAVVFVLVILARLDKLNFFEKAVGEHSAQDVLDLIAGRK